MLEQSAAEILKQPMRRMGMWACAGDEGGKRVQRIARPKQRQGSRQAGDDLPGLKIDCAQIQRAQDPHGHLGGQILFGKRTREARDMVPAMTLIDAALSDRPEPMRGEFMGEESASGSKAMRR